MDKTSETSGPVGLIAGGGQFPLRIADAARAKGVQVVAVAHRGETDPALSERVDAIVWVKLGQLGQIIRSFKKWRVSRAVMAGTITKKRMFENILPDFKGLKLMSRLAVFHDDDILRAVAEELRVDGIEIVHSSFLVPELLAPEGCLTRKKPSRTEEEEVRFGWRIAKELGRLDIGQCVVVRKKTVLALEALEGTDETILRGGALAREKAVVVKVSKPDQDLRFDVPSVGLGTIETMARVKASILAVEAGRTLLFDRPEMVALADRLGICITALKE